MKRELSTNLLVFFLLVAIGVATRWASDAFQPTLSNVTATAAASLFAGFFFVPRFVAPFVPLSIFALSNLLLAKYNNRTEMLVVFVMYILPTVLGWVLQRRSSVPRILGCAATPSILFYLVSDLVFWPGFELYPRTLAGQLESYAAALPFSAKMLAGDLLFSGLLFGTYWLVTAYRRTPDAAVAFASTQGELSPVPVVAK